MNSDILSLGIIVTTIIVIPIYKSLLEVYPIFNLQTRYSFKVLNVACYKGYVLFKSSGCNEHVHIANAKALFFKSPAYFSVFAHILYGIMLKKFGNFRNIVEVFVFARLECAKIKLCQSYVRNLTVICANFPKALNHIWAFLKQCDADACVEKIDVVCTHNYQVSTSLTISAPCRSSFATVIASAEPPKSPLNFFNASSRRALLSCFNSDSLGIISLLASHSRSSCESESPCKYVHRLFNANDVIIQLPLISLQK